MKLSALICTAMMLVPAVQAVDTLDISVLEVEGGKAEIIRTPSGQAVLIDAGFPSANGRDIQRILAAAKEIGITSFDYLIVSHFDVDHVGNVPALAAEIPVRRLSITACSLPIRRWIRSTRGRARPISRLGRAKSE
jgi:competence protein ComEC